MLSAENRITTKELSKLRRGRTIRTDHLLFSYYPSSDKETHFACSVAKKVAKHAVVRNRLKRQCRHALRDVLSQFPTPIIGMVRIIDAKITWADFKSELKEIIDGVGQ